MLSITKREISLVSDPRGPSILILLTKKRPDVSRVLPYSNHRARSAWNESTGDERKVLRRAIQNRNNNNINSHGVSLNAFSRSVRVAAPAKASRIYSRANCSSGQNGAEIRPIVRRSRHASRCPSTRGYGREMEFLKDAAAPRSLRCSRLSGRLVFPDSSRLREQR